jgi:hypothetical protein
LILADAICKHATVVAIVVHTPLNVDSVASCVGDDRLRTPSWTWLIVID